MFEGRPCTIHPAEPVVGACARCGDFGCRECLPDGRRCVRCGSTPLVKPDLGVGIKWVFQDPDYVSKVLMGAGCLFLSFFLIPMFILLGYHLTIARNERMAPQSRLPDWNDWGRYFWDGLKFYACIMFLMIGIEFLFLTIAGVVILVIALLGNAGGNVGAVIAGLVGMAALLTFVPLVFAIGYSFPAIQLEYLRTSSVFAGFHWGRIWRIVAGRPGDYFMLFVSAFVVRALGNLVGQLLCLVGIFLTAPWTLYTEGWMIGRYWAWLDEVEGGPV